jgi:hypothetical protein
MWEARPKIPERARGVQKSAAALPIGAAARPVAQIGAAVAANV